MIQGRIRFIKKEKIARTGMAVAAEGPSEAVAVSWSATADMGTAAHSRPRLEPLHSLAKRPGGYEP